MGNVSLLHLLRTAFIAQKHDCLNPAHRVFMYCPQVVTKSITGRDHRTPPTHHCTSHMHDSLAVQVKPITAAGEQQHEISKGCFPEPERNF